MRRISKSVANWLSIESEAGVTAIEYGLIASLIALAIIVAVTLVGTNLATLFTTIASKSAGEHETRVGSSPSNRQRLPEDAAALERRRDCGKGRGNRMSFLLIRAILWAAVLTVLVAAAGIDLKRRIIPNETVALVAVGGVVLSVLSRPGSTWLSVLFSLIVLLALLVLAHFDVLGGGDAKLIAAATLLVPPDAIALLLVAIALAGGLLSGVYLAAYHGLKRARATEPNGARSVRRSTGAFAKFRRNEHARMRAGQSVPYALAVLAGVAFYLASEIYQCSSGISCLL